MSFPELSQFAIFSKNIFTQPLENQKITPTFAVPKTGINKIDKKGKNAYYSAIS